MAKFENVVDELTAAVNSKWCNCHGEEGNSTGRRPRMFCKPSNKERAHISIDTIINDLRIMLDDIVKEEGKCKAGDGGSKSRCTSSCHSPEQQGQSKESCTGCNALEANRTARGYCCKQPSVLAFRETKPKQSRCQCSKYNGLQDTYDGYYCKNRNCIKNPFSLAKQLPELSAESCERNRD